MMDNKDEAIFLPTLAPMPQPPSDNSDIEQWQKHVMAMDKYILDINALVQKIETNDLAKTFKDRLQEIGVEIDDPKALPHSLMDDIAKKMDQLRVKFKEIGVHLGIEAGVTRHARAPKITTNRNIKPI